MVWAHHRQGGYICNLTGMYTQLLISTVQYSRVQHAARSVRSWLFHLLKNCWSGSCRRILIIDAVRIDILLFYHFIIMSIIILPIIFKSDLKIFEFPVKAGLGTLKFR